MKICNTNFMMSWFFFYFQVSSDSAGTYLSISFYSSPPLEVVMVLKNVQSCEKANIILFDSKLVECQITQISTNNGFTECQFNCRSSCSSIATIKFEKARFNPQHWSVCELYEARFKFQQTFRNAPWNIITVKSL